MRDQSAEEAKPTMSHLSARLIAPLSVVTVFGLVTLLGVGSAGAGQPETVELTETQLELNEGGIDAIADGDYQRAIRFFETALDIGEANLLVANLGRAYQRQGDCEQADQTFQRALQAPTVHQPSRQQVEEAIEKYRQQMKQDCPGYLKLECTPEQLELYIDGEGPRDCWGDRREFAPGTYSLRGEYGQQATETTVAIEALELSRVELTLQGIDQFSPGTDVELEEPTSHNGWWWLSAGVAAVAGGIALDTIPADARNNEINTINFAPPILYAVGIGFGYLGVRSFMD